MSPYRVASPPPLEPQEPKETDWRQVFLFLAVGILFALLFGATTCLVEEFQNSPPSQCSE